MPMPSGGDCRLEVATWRLQALVTAMMPVMESWRTMFSMLSSVRKDVDAKLKNTTSATSAATKRGADCGRHRFFNKVDA